MVIISYFHNKSWSQYISVRDPSKPRKIQASKESFWRWMLNDTNKEYYKVWYSNTFWSEALCYRSSKIRSWVVLVLFCPIGLIAFTTLYWSHHFSLPLKRVYNKKVTYRSYFSHCCCRRIGGISLWPVLILCFSLIDAAHDFSNSFLSVIFLRWAAWMSWIKLKL